MTQPEREALRELVALKDLKDEIRRMSIEPSDGGHGDALYEAKDADYARRKPLAWAAARLALSPPTPVSGEPTTPLSVHSVEAPVPLSDAADEGTPQRKPMSAPSREWLERMRDFGDPPACPGCGLMAGCCYNFPNCPGGKS